MAYKKSNCLYSGNEFSTAVAALVYNLWRTRNEVLWLSKLWLVSNTVKRVKLDVQMRVKVVMPKKVSKSDREWFQYICTQ